MAADDSTRYGDLCRLCASKTNMIMGINIFENEGAIRQINKKIETCLPIQVHESDELPKMICESCVYKLELFYEFRERSLRTEGLLIELFKELCSTKISTLNKISQPLNINLNHTDIVLVQHTDLLNSQNLQGVPDIDLSHLAHRQIMTDQEMILNHQSTNINAHSLNTIDLNQHELTGHELSNHSLSSQEAIIVNTSTDVQMLQHSRYMEDTLSLMPAEQHLITEQYNLQQEVHLSSNQQHTINDVSPQPELPVAEENVFEHSNDKSIEAEKPNYKSSNNEEISNINIPTQNTAHYKLTETAALLLICSFCGKYFKEKVEYQEHYNQHLKKCSICSVLFIDGDSLKAHENEVHNTNSSAESPKSPKPKCKKATTVILRRDQSPPSKNENSNEEEDGPLKDDEEDYNPIQKRKKWFPKVCKECGKTYKTNYKLMEHMRKHTGEKPYKCGSCDKAFRSKIGLAQHEAKHTGQYDLSCPTCGKGFQCRSYLMVHQRVHSDIKPFPCTTCGREFKTKQSLLDHTNRHLGVKPHICEVCGRGFITKGLCRAHQKTHYGTDNRKFSCNVCNKMFVSKSYLQTHQRIHTGEKPFVCEFCNKGFLTKVDLRIHSTMHTGEKSYVCEICGKAFARRDALRCHRRSHTGERPYSCEVCGQTFTQFSPMAIHKRLHTGERPYPCEICGKTFVSRSTMMSHFKKHIKKDLI